MQGTGTMSGARRRGRPRTAWMDNINTWTGLPVEESVRTTEDRDTLRTGPWYGQPSDRGRLKNRTKQMPNFVPIAQTVSEIAIFATFQDGGRSPSRISENSKF